MVDLKEDLKRRGELKEHSLTALVAGMMRISEARVQTSDNNDLLARERFCKYWKTEFRLQVAYSAGHN